MCVQRLPAIEAKHYNLLHCLPELLLHAYAHTDTHTHILHTGEFESINNPMNQGALHNPNFLIVAALSGLIGFAISFSSLWFLSQASSHPRAPWQGMRAFFCLAYLFTYISASELMLDWALDMIVHLISAGLSGYQLPCTSRVPLVNLIPPTHAACLTLVKMMVV